VQSALVIFVGGSLVAGFAPNMGVLIGARAIQGLGVGGLTALVQVVIASMVSPRERGRYSGYIGAVFALATVSGPLIGGLVVDTIGWRWCFFVGIPVAALAFVVLQKTLHLPVVKREVHIDYLAPPCWSPASPSFWSGSPWPASTSTGCRPPPRCWSRPVSWCSRRRCTSR
jgi:MFS family permease